MFVHLLSKETRTRIIKLVVESVLDQDTAANILGVSRTAVYKFLQGSIHPSDRVTLAALNYLKQRKNAEWSQAVHLVTGELTKALQQFADYAGIKVDCRTYNTILGVIA